MNEDPWLPEARWLAPLFAALLVPGTYLFFSGIPGLVFILGSIGDLC